MQKELKPKDNIKEQFKEHAIPEQGKQPTPEEIARFKKDQTEFLEAELPFLRLQHEYDTLQIASLTNAVKLGKMTVRQLPVGLLQLELQTSEIEYTHYLMQFKLGQEAAEKAQKEQQEKEAAKEQPKGSSIIQP